MAKLVNLQDRPAYEFGENDVYIGPRTKLGGRNLPKSDWANPFTENGYMRASHLTCWMYDEWIRSENRFMQELSSLENKTLVCSCGSHTVCHGQVLLTLVAENKIHWKKLKKIQATDAAPLLCYEFLDPNSR